MRIIKNAMMIIPIVMFAMLTSCEYEHPVPETEIPEVVSFSVDLQPYFDKSCNMAGCHSAFGIAPRLSADKAYDEIFKYQLIDLDEPENSRFYTKIAPGGSMEPYSTSQETATVLKWIEQGALNN